MTNLTTRIGVAFRTNSISVPAGTSFRVDSRLAQLTSDKSSYSVGERVTVLDLTTSAVLDHRLVEVNGERVADGDVSIHAPLGSALLGRHVGDVVTVEDDGQVMRLEVVEIDG